MTRIALEPLTTEEILLRDLHLVGIPEPVIEYRFAAHIVGLGPGIRKRLRDAGLKDWRFDMAWKSDMLALEIEGGAWMGKGHTGGKKFTDDCRKYNIAQLYGWTVLRYTTQQVEQGIAIDDLLRYFGGYYE